MEIAEFRRYLQPSPSLRWHPWAPRIAAAACALVIFALGVDLGIKIEKRQLRFAQYRPAIFETMIRFEELARPTAGLIRRAGMIDDAVRTWVEQESTRGWVDDALDALDARFSRFGMSRHAMLQSAIVRAAEWRLAHFAGSAPEWQPTSTYCQDYGTLGGDVSSRYERPAEAYTRLLGREVRAAQLAPAVPGGKCS